MHLKLEGPRIIDNPSDEEIASALPEVKFAVIEDWKDSGSYLQFCISRKRGIELEYQVHTLKNHFKAPGTSLTMNAVIRAFQKYARGDETWKTDFEWQRMEVINIQGHEVLVAREWIKRLADAAES